jgi:hypothetical protein
MKRLLCVLALAAGCGNSNNMGMDLAVMDLMDPGDLLPIDAGFLPRCNEPAMIDTTFHVLGTVKGPGGVGLGGIEVAFYDDTDTLVGTGTYSNDAGAGTGSDGTFEIDGTVGNKPFWGYFVFTGVGYSTVRWYLRITAPNFLATIGILSDAQIDAGYASAQVTRDTSKGSVLATFRHCNGKAINGATGSFLPAAGAVEYDDGKQLIPVPTATASSTLGNIFGLNIPPGPSTLTLTLGAQDFVFPPIVVPTNGSAVFSVSQ